MYSATTKMAQNCFGQSFINTCIFSFEPRFSHIKKIIFPTLFYIKKYMHNVFWKSNKKFWQPVIGMCVILTQTQIDKKKPEFGLGLPKMSCIYCECHMRLRLLVQKLFSLFSRDLNICWLSAAVVCDIVSVRMPLRTTVQTVAYLSLLLWAPLRRLRFLAGQTTFSPNSQLNIPLLPEIREIFAPIRESFIKL